ncbi:MAG: type II toxin-antitoxin system VapC family toxin [Anaerolineales bacterium]|nr:type II toxin-antitoxin system VapC family toxin [Anaerolineales bacterium]
MATAPALLDTTIVIEFLRKGDKKNAVLFKLVDNYDFYLSVITHFEVAIGLKTERQQAEYQDLLARCQILPLDLRCISQAVSIYRWLKLQNAQIGLADLLIGATALGYQLPLATLNEKHFARIPQLQWVDLSSP